MLVIALATLGSIPTRAREIDSFTHRFEILAVPEGELQGQPLSDFTPELNDNINRIVAEVLTRLNEENRRAGRSCSSKPARRRLFRKLRQALGGPIILTRNRLRPIINRHPNRFKTRLEGSVYRDFPLFKTFAMGLLSRVGDQMADAFRFDLKEVLVDHGGRVERLAGGRVRVAGIPDADSASGMRLATPGPAIRRTTAKTYYLLADGRALVESRGAVHLLTPVIVGSDKISHFFNRSSNLFDKLRNGAGLDEILAYNHRLEGTLWGTKTTGVASYGDMVANFQGMRFWIHLLGEDARGRQLVDPLAAAGRVDPYVDCSASSGWTPARRIAIESYLDPAWDEGLNCSDVRSLELLGMIAGRIEELQKNDPLRRSYRCPVAPELIRRAAESYGPLAARLINAEGHGVYSPTGRARRQ